MLPEDSDIPVRNYASSAEGRVDGAQTIAPAWHTVVLIAAIAAISVIGKLQLAGGHHSPNRTMTYATTAGMELILLGWIFLGVRARKVKLRSLLGSLAGGWRGFVMDLGVAAVFWIGALAVLATAGMLWTGTQVFIARMHGSAQAAQAVEQGMKNGETLHALEQLAPSNGEEVACWVGLCCLVGVIEEMVFRGYLQQQFIAWTGGGVVWGVVLSAILFGAGHGYQGLRNMVLLALFGALFGGLAIVRRNLRAGMIAHTWHDLIAGLALALLKSHHVV